MISDAQSDALPEDSGPNACTDASVVLIKASNYDQSCEVDTDCRLIAEGNACTPCAFNCPFSAAISVSALTKYNSDIANTSAVAQEVNGQTCLSGCGAAFGPCCVAGKCQTSTTDQCPAAMDAGDACAPPTVCPPVSCIIGAHNVTTMVDGCLVSRCCALDDAGTDAASDSGSADGSTEASSDAHAE